MWRPLALTLALPFLLNFGCGAESRPPNLGAIATYGVQQGTWDVSPIDPYTCGHYAFELENNDDRSYHFTRMAPANMVVQLAEGPYPTTALWGWMEVMEEFGQGYLILEPGERQDPLFQLCVDASTVFGRATTPGGEGFCIGEFDPTTGDYTGATGEMSMSFEGVLTMEGFDEYGNEFGPRGPTPQWLGITVRCVP